jgi:hypothetical protein
MPPRAEMILVLAAAAASSACSSSAGPDLRATRQGQLRIIAETCGLPPRALRLEEGGRIRFRPSPDTRYEVVDCALAQLRERRLIEHMPMAFVGSEALSEEAGNDASPH